MPNEIRYKWGQQRVALTDALHWLGYDNFKRVARLLKANADTEDARRTYGIQLEMFAGISGAPVEAMFDRYLSGKNHLERLPHLNNLSKHQWRELHNK